MVLCPQKLFTLRMVPLDNIERIVFMYSREIINVYWSYHISPVSQITLPLYTACKHIRKCAGDIRKC